jgi:hypothetical protein
MQTRTIVQELKFTAVSLEQAALRLETEETVESALRVHMVALEECDRLEEIAKMVGRMAHQLKPALSEQCVIR